MRMRKIDDELLMKRIAEGKSQKDIALEMSCSCPAISKRLKRLLPEPDLSDLTEKEKGFVQKLAQGKSATQAAFESYDVIDRNSAKSLASQLMGRDKIRVAIEKIMPMAYRLRRVRSHIALRDPQASLRALELSFKLDGSLQPESIEQQPTTVHVQILHFSKQNIEIKSEAEQPPLIEIAHDKNGEKD